MTKAENRAAAKAYHQEQERKRMEEIRKLAVDADLEELERIRRYLLTGSKTRVPTQDLISAIDDYVERLTGDRTTLHAKSCSIG